VLDQQQLRETTERLLAQFIVDMKNACKAPLFRQWGGLSPKVLDEKEDEFAKKVEFAVRHFDVGHINPPEPEVPATISNQIKVEHMIGGAIQQGTSGSRRMCQSASTSLKCETR